MTSSVLIFCYLILTCVNACDRCIHQTLKTTCRVMNHNKPPTRSEIKYILRNYTQLYLTIHCARITAAMTTGSTHLLYFYGNIKARGEPTAL